MRHSRPFPGLPLPGSDRQRIWEPQSTAVFMQAYSSRSGLSVSLMHNFHVLIRGTWFQYVLVRQVLQMSGVGLAVRTTPVFNKTIESLKYKVPKIL